MSRVHHLRPVGLELLDDAPVAHVLHHQIEAPPLAVWERLADSPATWSWFPTVQGGHFVGDERGVGAQREIHLRGARVLETVLAAEAGVRWAYRLDTTTVPLARAVVEDWQLTELPATSTRPASTAVQYTFAFDPFPGTARLLAAGGVGLERVFARAARNLDDLLRVS